MPFNSLRNGFQNEDDFIIKLNNRKVSDLDYNFQLFIEDIFGFIDYNNKIVCYKNKSKQKYDIFIKIGDVIKRVSIKKGVKNSVHAEPISEFIHFLIENKMPRYMIINLLKYHYADGSINGTGKNRISIDDYKIDHQNEIDEINEFFSSEDFLKRIIDRFIIRGRNSYKCVDVILYGVPNDFIWIKNDDIYKILLKKRHGYSTSLHFSSLTYQPLNRCLNYNSKYENGRFIVQIKWYNLCDDIIENMNDNVVDVDVVQ